MFGDAVRSRRHRIRFVAVAPAPGAGRLANIRADDADRVVDRERERHRAPLAGLVEHELRRRGTAASQGREQLESPVVLIRREYLPAAFVLVPHAPDPVAAAELHRRESGCLVQGNHRRAFGGRVADGVPDRFGRFAGVRRIVQTGLEIEDGPAAAHLHPAIGLGRCRRLPGSRQLKDGETRPIAQAHDRPLHTQARFLPENASQTVGRTAKESRLIRHDLGERIGFADHVHAHRHDAGNDAAPNTAARQGIEQDGETLALSRIDRLDAVEIDPVLELLQVVRRSDDRRAERQHAVAVLVDARLVTDLDDSRLAELVARFLLNVVPTGTLGADRVQERVVGLGGNLQPLARLHFFQGVAHRSGSYPEAGEVSLVVDLLDVGRDRLLHQHVLVFRIRVADP